jgi:hypothetical protein
MGHDFVLAVANELQKGLEANEQGERRFAIRTFVFYRVRASFRDGCALYATAIALVLASVASVVEFVFASAAARAQ